MTLTFQIWVWTTHCRSPGPRDEILEISTISAASETLRSSVLVRPISHLHVFHRCTHGPKDPPHSPPRLVLPPWFSKPKFYSPTFINLTILTNVFWFGLVPSWSPQPEISSQHIQRVCPLCIRLSPQTPDSERFASDCAYRRGLTKPDLPHHTTKAKRLSIHTPLTVLRVC